ncbi:MAG: M18 family aminopeptidase [Pseudomonadales bacterium]|nr:M18 family aminopeptidase [Pseudomonadales bacterium]
MNTSTINQQLMAFLTASPTPFHAVANMSMELAAAGFQQLNETDKWSLSAGKYFVTRNDSAIIAFVLGSDDPIETGLRLVGAHTDSPCLRVKPNPDQTMNGYLNLGVEVYGGALLNPWFDRDLSLAGRVTYTNQTNKICNSLVNFNRPIATIPSLAIHLDRDANNNRSINPQKHIKPLLLSQNVAQGKTQNPADSTSLEQIIIKQLHQEHQDTDVNKILSYELSFYDINPAAMIGVNNEFIASARLDNLLSCYIGLKSLLQADDKLTSMLVCSDHEEVGSVSAAGAQGTFLKDILLRMLADDENRLRTLARSVLISTDNAHGIHPNYADKHDSAHAPLLNQGPVIKINSNQRYATNSQTAGYFQALCDAQDIPCQKFVVRSDMACGSTIGPLTASELGIQTIDVGVPTFAMHSIRELAGNEDTEHLFSALKAFYRDPAPLSI